MERYYVETPTQLRQPRILAVYLYSVATNSWEQI